MGHGCIITPFEFLIIATTTLLVISIPIMTLAALFMNVKEIANIRKSGRRLRNAIPPITGLLLSCLIFILLGFLASALTKTHCGPRRAHCINNLKQLGLVLNMYAYENDERFPPIDSMKNHFIFESDVLYPEYLSDAGIVACPSDPAYDPNANFRLISTESHPGSSVGEVHPDCITDMSYVYLGWLVMSDEEAETFFDAYDRLPPEDYDEFMLVGEGKGTVGTPTFPRLSTDVDRFLITDINGINSGIETDASRTPIMWDRPYAATDKLSHQNSEDEDSPGGYVLYLDGHVEYVAMGEKFPMTETMARLLEERPREFIPDCE